jgi:hypothetical protein
MAHLRCTDWNGANEVTTLLRYIRYAFDLSMVNVCPPVAGPFARPELWAGEAIDNMMKRWNGPDGAFNPGRPWIVPNPGPGQVAPPLKSQVLTLLQYVSPPVCHFRIRTVAPSIGSYVNALGDGQFRVNSIRHDPGPLLGGPTDDWGRNRTPAPGRGLAAAHETGHAGSMPDEYDYARPEECLGYNWLHIAANPFQRDDSAVHAALMKQNGVIRPRYYWHAAEFLHSLHGMNLTNWRVDHEPGLHYSLPHYPHKAAHPDRDFYTWPVRLSIRQPPAGQNYLFDSFLYFMGEESYTTTVLPAPLDGILVVMIRAFLNLDIIPNEALRNAISRRIYVRVQDGFDTLNGRFRADFQTYGGARRQPDFNNCMIHFVPGVNLRGAVHPKPPKAPETTWLERRNASREHVALRFVTDGHNMVPLHTTWSLNAPAASNRLDVRWRPADWGPLPGPARTAWLDAVGDELFRRCIETLGLSVAPASPRNCNSPPSYRHIVRTVMDNAAPDPIIR